MARSGGKRSKLGPMCVVALAAGGLAGPVSIAGADPLAYGPDTCIQGYVWREAQPSDHVCVSPNIRDDTANENAAAAQNVEPGGGAYGPNTCKQGFVWREAFSGDVVCVTPGVRSQAAKDNAAAQSRYQRNQASAQPAQPPEDKGAPPAPPEWIPGPGGGGGGGGGGGDLSGDKIPDVDICHNSSIGPAGTNDACMLAPDG